MKNYIDMGARVILPFAVLAAVSLYQAVRTWKRRWGTGPTREWPTTNAVIDVVSVAEEIREGRYDTVETIGYKATLTYFYRNPDLEMGEYSQSFPLEGAARQWVETFKNKSVIVHVNPKDPTDSILLKNDLDGLGVSPQQTLEESLRMERFPQLPSGYLILSSISEFLAIVGLSLTAIAAWMHVRRATPAWLVVTLVVLLVLVSLSTWLVSYRSEDSHRLQSMLHSYTLFCPVWMRWGVRLTGGLLVIAWFAYKINELFPSQVQQWLVTWSSYWSYVFAVWVFLSTGATHAAILRSQEVAHRTTVSDAMEASGKS